MQYVVSAASVPVAMGLFELLAGQTAQRLR